MENLGTFSIGQSIYVNLTFRGLKSFTASASTDRLTVTSHGYSTGDPVTLSNVGGSLPTPLIADNTYYVNSVDANTITLAVTPGGTAIDLTDIGAGVNYIFGPADPTTIALTLERPSGVTTAYVIGDFTRDKTGFYHKVVTPAAGEWGDWTAHVESTGAAAGAADFAFTVIQNETA